MMLYHPKMIPANPPDKIRRMKINANKLSQIAPG